MSPFPPPSDHTPPPGHLPPKPPVSNQPPPPPPPPPPGGIPGYQAPGTVWSPGMVTTKPQNHLIWAIASTLLCCMPLGIVSIVFAAQVDSAWNAGDHAKAQASSEKAKNFAIASAAISIAVSVIYLLAAVSLGVESEANFQ